MKKVGNEIHFILLMLMSIQFACRAQDPQQGICTSAALKVGYTFGAGFTYGYELSISMNVLSQPNNMSLGISHTHYWMNVNKRFHHQRAHNISAISLMAKGDFYDVKYGWGRVLNKWGADRRNHCYITGTYLDLSINSPTIPDLAIGASGFFYKAYKWPWFNQPYYTLYTRYNNLFTNSLPGTSSKLFK